MNSSAIKKKLLKGGLVIAPRRSGKTTALLSILENDPGTILVVPTEKMRKHICCPMLKSKLNMLRIVSALDSDLEVKLKAYKVLVDEWFWNSYKGPFFAAASTAPFQIHSVKPNAKLKKLFKNLMYFNPWELEPVK